MRKTLLFTLLSLLLGVAQLNAESLTEGFEEISLTDANGNALANSWSIGYGLSNGWKVIGGTIFSSSGSTNYGLWSTAHTGSKALEASYGASNAASVVITQKLTGEFSFWARKTSSSSNGTVILYEAEEDGDTYKVTSTKLYENSSLTTTWTKYTVDLGSEGKFVAINLVRAGIDDIEGTIYEEAEEPKLSVLSGGKVIKSGVSHEFGLSESGSTVSYTLKNSGIGTLRVTSIVAPEGFSVDKTAVELEAGETEDVTITFEKTGSGSVIIAAEGQEDFVINVSGTIRDPNKIFVDFAGGTLPDGWTTENKSTYYSWAFSEGYASHPGISASYGGTLTSPQLSFKEGEKVLFYVANYGSSTWYTPSVSVKTSTDGKTWTTLETFTDAEYGTWKIYSVIIPSADVKYIQFDGCYIHITNIYGGEPPAIPILKAEVADLDFGMIAEEANKSYTIKNIGGSELTGLTASSDNTNFKVDVSDKIAAGESTELTVTLLTTEKGAQSATITVSAPEQDPVTFNVSGYVVDTDKLYVTFDDNKLPDGWENTGWTFSDGCATGVYTSSTPSLNSEMITPALSVAEGETLAIEAMGTSNYAQLRVYASTDKGATWTLVKNFDTEMRANTNNYTAVIVSGLTEGSYKLKFEGYAVRLNTINGFQLDDNAPALKVFFNDKVVTTGEAADFGKVKGQPVAKTYTVTNAGTGVLNVAITSSDAYFTISKTELSLGKGESTTFELGLVFDDNYGEKSADITITPSYDEAAAIVIKATAITADPNIWEEDFESGAIPEGWINNGWTINTQRHPGMAYAGSSDDNMLITPRLYATKEQTLRFEVVEAEETYPQKVEWSHDREEWTLVDSYMEDGVKVFTAPEDGHYYLRFSGRYTYVDNFYGFKLDQAEHDVIISKSNLPAVGYQYAEYVATVTLKEQVGKDEDLTATLIINDDDVVSVDGKVTANGEIELTLRYTPEEVLENATAYIEVVYEGGSLVTDKIAFTVNPALVIDEEAENIFENATYPSVIVKYTAKAGWNTITLPFAVSDLSVFGEGVKAYEFSGYKDGVLSFKVATNFVAGYPYILYVETPAKNELLFLNANITATTEKYDSYNGAIFQGTYAPIAAPGMAGKYGVVPSTGKIQKGGQKASLKAMRAYFELPDQQGATEFTLNFEDGGVVNSIGAVEFVNGQTGKVYDLSGRRVNVSQLRPGVYVKDGKKFVVK